VDSSPRTIDAYAAGLLEIAGAEADEDAIADELYRIARAIDGSDELRGTLTDPRVPAERKQGAVVDLLGRRAQPVSIALVNLLVGAGRAGDLVAVATRMVELAAEREELAVAEVRSAVELDDDTVSRLEEKLSAAVGKRVRAKVVVDPGVVGGVISKVGDMVFDGSVKSRLQDLREAWG